MVVANSIVAQTNFQHFPSCALLRKHPPPPETKLRFLKDLCEYLKIPVDIRSNQAIAESIRRVREIPDEAQRDMLMIFFRKWGFIADLMHSSMSEAQYVCSGEQPMEGEEGSKNPFEHYGLGIAYYTHFTSPIRRYADIIVHRQLLQSIEMDREKGKRGNGEEEKKEKEKEKEGYDLYGVKSKVVSIRDAEVKVKVTGEDVKRVLKRRDGGEKGLVFRHEGEAGGNESGNASGNESGNGQMGEVKSEIDDDFFNEMLDDSSDETPMKDETPFQRETPIKDETPSHLNSEIDDDFFNEMLDDSSDETSISSDDETPNNHNETPTNPEDETPTNHNETPTNHNETPINPKNETPTSLLFTKGEMTLVSKQRRFRGELTCSERATSSLEGSFPPFRSPFHHPVCSLQPASNPSRDYLENLRQRRFRADSIFRHDFYDSLFR